MTNALSIDLEDWFCVANLATAIPRARWDECDLRVVESTQKILRMLEAHHTRATFFVLGWIAERVPGLIREIDAAGHEIAVHGYDHRLLTQMTPEEFDSDISRAIDAIRRCGITSDLIGFRAPSFTLTKETMWAIPILEANGFRYDSSIFPVGFHPDYGIADAPLTPFDLSPRLREFPISCIELFGRRLPFAGGAYFRFFPYAYTRACMRRCNSQGRAVVFYLHPWEFDPDQPRLSLPANKRARHYFQLGKTERRFERLLTDFSFDTIRNVLHL